LAALYNAALRLTGNDHDAEDLVQETYLHALQHADELRSLAACRVWLFRIMRNRFVSERRAARSRPELVVIEKNIEESRAAADIALQADRAAIARMSRAAIVKALAHLPDDMRTAVMMCDVEGFSYQEIAEIVGCPVGTVRSRIARAREALMHSLAAQARALGITKGHTA